MGSGPADERSFGFCSIQLQLCQLVAPENVPERNIARIFLQNADYLVVFIPLNIYYFSFTWDPSLFELFPTPLIYLNKYTCQAHKSFFNQLRRL